MDKNIKKYVYTPIIFIILGVCVLSLPYYYQCKAYLSYDKPSMEFAYRNSAIGVSILPSTKAEMLRDRAMWFYVNGQRENCITDLIKIESMKQAIEDDYGKPNEIAKVYLGMNELNIALKFSNKAVDDKTNKQYSKYLTRAKIQMQMGRYYDALMDLNTLVNYMPNEAWPYYERAKLKRALRDFRGAEADTQKARQLEQKDKSSENTNNMIAEKQ